MINQPDEYRSEEEHIGSLLDINLTDVLQVLSVNKKTCTLFLKKGNEKGEIYLKDGRIVDASTGSISGESALFHLLDWEGADFYIGTSVEKNVTVRIEKDIHALILDWIEYRETHKGKEETKEQPLTSETTAKEVHTVVDETLVFLKRLESEGLIKAIHNES
ncbi:MAG: hypothetical protein A2132_05885 [Nitrospirae bacterium RBG_16_43_11]|nr:MAG: hypothetical protein A2132_05885 [Nitrospirae bacterium RBG_16_43_11]